MATAILATTIQEITLKPAVRKRLLNELQTYAALSTQRAIIDAKMAAARSVVEDIQTELEESSITIEGFKSTIVAPTRSVFDRKKYVQLGGRLDLIEAATSKVPGKSYLRITAPGDRERSADTDGE